MDYAIHVIYECPELEYARSDAWTKVLASIPSAMANQIDTFSTQNKLLYILSGLQGPYVREWGDIYRNIALFVHRMFSTRYQLYNSISCNNIWDLLNPCFLQMSCANVCIHELYYLSSHSPFFFQFCICSSEMVEVNTYTLRWRHNDHAGVSNHQPHGCLLNRLFRRNSKKTSKLRVTGLCAGNSPGTGEFPAQMASYAENVSIWWRHRVYSFSCATLIIALSVWYTCRIHGYHTSH